MIRFGSECSMTVLAMIRAHEPESIDLIPPRKMSSMVHAVASHMSE